MMKWLENYVTTLKSFGAFALCFVMLFAVMGAVCLPENALAVSNADVNPVDDDVASLRQSSEIALFANVTFTPPLPEDGGYLENQEYIIHFVVDEVNARGMVTQDNTKVDYLFDPTGMQYPLPEGLDYTLTIPETGRLKLWARDYQKNQDFAVEADVKIVNQHGRDILQVIWDQNSPGWYLLTIATNARYELEVKAGLDNSKDVIDFGDGKKYYTDNTARAGFTKTINPETLRNKLTDDDKQAFKFTLKNVCVAKDASKKGENETVDTKGFVRDANGNIVYEDPQDIQVSLADMTWYDNNKHFVYNFPERLKPTDQHIVVTETEKLDKLHGYTWSSGQTEATHNQELNGGSNRIVSLDNTYVEDQAKLKITKAFTGTGADVLTDAQKNAITFRVQGTKANGDSYDQTFTYKQLMDANWEITLPAGKYKVTEDGRIANFTWEASCVVGTMTYFQHTSNSEFAVPGKQPSDGVTLGAGETVEFAFTNEYVQHLGNLKLYKTVQGITLDDDEEKAIKFTVKTENGETVKWTKRVNGNSYSYVYDPNGTVTEIPYSDFGYSSTVQGATQGVLTLHSLPVGEYTVTETGVAMEGYTCSTKVKELYMSERTATSIDTDVDKDKNTEIYFRNIYTENGKISLKKNVEGALSLSDVIDKVKFTLQKMDENGNWVNTEHVNLTVDANGVLYGEGLPFGEYRIVEDAEAVPNYSMKTDITVTPSQGAIVDANNKHVTFTLSDTNHNVATEFTNTYTPKTGELTLTKSLKGPYPADATSKISFKVQDGTKTLKWTKVTDNEYKYDPNGTITDIPYGASIKLTGLPGGYTYTVTETVGSYSGSYLVSTKANGTTGTSASVTMQEGTDGKVNNGTVAFENTYQPIARIQIKKTFTGVLSDKYVNEEILNKQLRFVISKVEGGKTLYRSEAGNWVEGKSNAKQFEYEELANGNGLELEANKVYYIEELNAGVTGFTVSTWWADNDTDNPTQVTSGNLPHVEVKPGETPTINFINDYRAEGKIVGPSAQLNTKTWAGLEGSADQNGSELKTAMDDVRFKIEYWNGTEWKEYDTYTLGQLMSGKKNYPKPDKTSEEAWITLPAGKYRLTEADYTVDGYDHQLYITLVKNDNVANAETELLTKKQIEFEVKDGETVQFGFANVYTPKGKLNIKKVFTGLDNANRTKSVKFVLKRELKGNIDPQFEQTIFLSAFTNGVYTWTDLPLGINEEQSDGTWKLNYYDYIIKEAEQSVDYHTYVKTTVKVNNAAAEESDTVRVQLQKGTTASVTVEFNNIYKRNKGELSIVKNIDGDVPSADANKITFQVKDANNKVVTWNVDNGVNVCPDTGTGAKDSFTYADMALVNNQGTFTITNLSTGTYTLVETNADIAGYSRETEFKVGNQSTDKATVKTNETATIEVTNTYKQVGKLIIEKRFKVDGAGFENEWFNARNTIFKVLDAETKQQVSAFTLWAASQPEKVNGSNNEWVITKTIENLTPGEYIVEESNMELDGYTVVTKYKVGVNGTETDGDTATINIAQGENKVFYTNTYTEQGKLSVRKTFSGIDASKFTAEQKSKIVFGLFDASNVLIPAKADDAIADSEYAGWVSYDKMTNGTYTWENLDVNKQYYVKEYVIGENNDNTATDSTFYGYIHKQTSWTGATTGSTTEVPGTVQTGNVTVNKNGVQIDFTNTYEQVKRLSATKTAQNYSSDMVGDDKLPVWHFTVTVNNVGAGSMQNNQMVITDVFDTQNPEWFRLVDVEGFRPAIQTGEKVTLTANDKGDGTAEYVLTLQEDAPADQTVVFTYYLQPKDFATFQTMLQDPTHRTTVERDATGNATKATWTYTNTITYKPMPNEDPVSVPANYFYNTDMVTKTMTSADGNMNVTFTLNINPDALYIGNNQRLVVLDKMSDNVEVNMSSFTVVPENLRSEVKVSRYTGEDKAWDLQIEVPNGVALTITYSATIKDPTGNVHVTNKVSMEGVIQEVEDDVEFEGGNSGYMSAGVVSIFKSGDTYTVPLKGAKFALYQCENSLLEQLTNPVLLGEFTTGDNGIVAIQSWKNEYSNDSLRWDILYYLVEISAPEGYELAEPNEPIYFRIYEDEAEKVQGKEYYVKTGTVFDRSNASFKGSVVLEAEKTLKGKNLAENQFSFNLLDAEGHFLQTKQNDANGKVTFDVLNYSYERFSEAEKAAGKQVHQFVIEEVNANASGYAYDSRKYDVTVTVSLVKDTAGKVTGVTVNPVYTLNDATVDGAVFSNEYSAVGSVKPEGTKTLENATKINDVFSFQIKEGDNERATVTSPVNENGKTVAIPYPEFKYVVDADATAGVVYADGVITTTVKKAEDLASTYTYTIEETDKTNNSIEYDNTVYTYTVSVSDAGNGKLNVSGQLSVNGQQLGATEKADFTNTYYGELKIIKQVTVGGNPTTGTLADGTYTFTVYTDADCTDIAKDKDGNELVLELTIVNGVSAEKTLTGIVPGTYWVKETAGDNDGVDLDTEKKEVVISGDSAADLVEVNITNNLGIGDLSLQKIVTGTAATDKVFTFTVTIQAAAGNTYAAEGAAQSVIFNAEGVATVSLKANETITIKGLPHGAAYKVEETVMPSGYSKGAITNGEGSIAAGQTVVVIQNNTYAMEPTSIDLHATKAMKGNDYTGSFIFALNGTATSGNNNVLDSTTALAQTVAQNGTATWKINYTVPGVYRYTISETAGNVPGMAYSTKPVQVTVTVVDDGDGTMSATAVYANGDGDAHNVITNTYSMITFQPEVTKALAGTNVPSETYTFQLLDATGDVLDTATVTGAGAVVFDEITKYAAGTYTYTIREVAGYTPGLSYSTDAITYRVVVTEKEQTGELIKTETYSGGTGEKNNTLTNTYATVQDTPHVKKSLQGNVDWFGGQETEEFRFTLERIEAPNGAESFAKRNASCTLQEGMASFGEITYKVAGTYIYEIAEIAGQTEGMEYSKEKIIYTVVIEKTASPENKLYVKSATYAGGAGEDKDTITNTYRETSFQLHVGKALTDSMNLYTANENFGFTLSGSGIQPVTQYCQAGGTVVFAPITVYAVGEYKYTITEVKGRTPGMAYDAVAHEAIVTVTEDRDTGAISAVVKYDDNQDILTITNTYTPVSFTPVINKVLTGDKELYTANETFNFVLIQASGDAVQNPENALTASCTLEQGQAVFAPIVYTQPGEYHYTIQEVIPDNKTAGMHYSTEVINCKVTVSQAENATNALTATAVYTGSNNLPLDTITNKYGETSFTPVVQKVVDKTGPYDLPAETFVFTLTTVLDDGTIHTENKTVTNGETVAFSSIVYHKEGTYTIKITEEEPSDNAVPGKTPGMTYSKETVVYTVVVTCHDDGSLTTAHSCKVGNADSNTITNTYVQPEGEATLQAKKLLSGNVDAYKATHSIKPFKFLLTINDNPLNTATNNLLVGGSGEKSVMIDQTVSWTIKYDQPGTYEYTIQEIAPTNQTLGMEYDAKVHTVKVEMGYTADKMALEPKSVTYDEQKVDLLEITNKYSRISAQPKIIKVVKALTENILAEVFTFQITEQAETETPYTGLAYATIVRSDANPVELLTAEAIFNPITYYAEGSYKYSIVELAPEEGKGTPGMNYSKEVITYTVEILRDQETGELTVGSQTYTNGLDENSNTITNIYDRPDTDAVIQVQKKLSGNPYNRTNKEFEFTLTKDTIFIVPSETNDVVIERLAQTIKADTDEMAVWSIHYDQPGVYTYTIRETIPADADQIPGMEYDATEYKVTVNVTYDETGNDLVTEVIYENGETNEAKDTLLVTNKYSEITFNPSVEKTLTGENLLKETFNFILTQKKPEMDDPYTCMGSVTVDPETGVTTGVVPFTTPVYHSEGEYVYEIVEIKPENPDDRTPGMTYSPETIVYTVIVERNKDTGELTVVKETYITRNKVQTDTTDASTEDVEGKTFTNAYARPEGEAQINVTKAMTGNAYHGKNDFEFVLNKFVPVEGEVQTPADSETNNVVMSEQSQTIGVGDMAAWTVKYDQPGTYYYTIQEIDGREIGMEYDETLYYVTVVVDYYQDENGDRMSLVSTVTYGKEPNGTDSSLTVTNKYSRTGFQPKVKKLVTGDDAPDETFTFQLKNGYGYVDTAQCKGGETAVFKPFVYHGPGVYVYTITELEPENKTPGMTYSDEVIVLTVTVIEADDGTLFISSSYSGGGVITNKYSRVEFVPEIDKIVNGNAPRETFTFQLTDGKGYWDTASCKDEETAVFNPIVYHEPGVYTYTITELEPEYKTPGMTYSDEVIVLTVEVTRAEDGTLSITASYTGGGVITNTYVPPEPGYDYKFSFTKKWQGGVEASIEWTLYNPDGTVAHKKFDKEIVNDREWYYEAWFPTDKDYYIIEEVPEGYIPIYVNVGEYVDVTDRLYNGGTIINYKVPQTGDNDAPAIWMAMMLCSAAAIAIKVLGRKREQ